MAPGADLPPDSGGEEEEESFDLNRLLRFLEGLAFCCLAAVVILWMVDRSRSVGFDPIIVDVCEAQTCLPPAADTANRPWAQFTQAIDQRGLIVMTPANTCSFVADLLQTRASEDGTDLVLSHMQDRGTVIVTPTADNMALLSPGPNNDDFWDIARDAIRWQGARGCHPMRYAAIFWPLVAVWLLLLGWRFFRHRQQVWATRAH